MTLDAEALSLLDLISDDPRHDDDYDRFVAALRLVARHHGGRVSTNHVREELSNSWGLTIEPRRFSTFYRRACKDGHIAWTGGYDTNTDQRGRNAGKPARLYEWTGATS